MRDNTPRLPNAGLRDGRRALTWRTYMQANSTEKEGLFKFLYEAALV
jgi:hypothetical protein